ncbi:MAG: hypothetical protein ABJ205_06655 [Erythrobacter sp.]|uniref:hypothetical protein n=1 Tax=Erythrobacter sp. TaxID=1042 RepID=UPI003266E75B
MVKRHLLTLFVLLSGLAALQAPAHGNAAETFAAHSRVIAGVLEASEATHARCAFAAQAEATGRASETSATLDAAPLPVLAAPYVFGVERALE